jgi:CheY-like chemotaxis protein
MTQPLALVLYEKILPGSRLVNRLQDLNYRVISLSEAAKLVERAEEVKPMLVLADLESSRGDVCAALGRLRQNGATGHLPILAFGADKDEKLQQAAREAGGTLVVAEAALLPYLEQLLEQVLRVD